MLINLIWLFFYVSQTNGDMKCLVTEHSYVVSIFYNASDSTHFMGLGTQVSQNWVLTSSAVAIHKETPQNYTVVAGAINVAEFNLGIAHMRKKPGFLISLLVTTIIDAAGAALMKVVKLIKENKNRLYVNLATSTDFRNNRLEHFCANATMIGYNAQVTTLGSKSQLLQCTQTSVIAQNICQQKLPHLELSLDMACVFRPNADHSHVTAGGPVMCNGIQCGLITDNYDRRPNIPVVFLRIDRYKNFIQSHVKLESDHLKESKCSSNHAINLFTLIMSFILYFITA